MENPREFFNPDNESLGLARPRDILIFLHIPKTGGTTISQIIMREYRSNLGALWLLYVHYDGALEAFTQLSAEERDRIDCLIGHMPFGAHQFFPRRTPRYLTLLREPVSRVCSQYGQTLSHPETLGRASPPARCLGSLDDYVSWLVDAGMMNLQTTMLSMGFQDIGGNMPIPLPSPPPDSLDVAKCNIEAHFVVVGVMDRFVESAQLMKEQLGWKVSLARKRDNIRRVRLPGMSPRVLERIAKLNSDDVDLVQFARTRLDRQLSIQPPRFFRKVRRVSCLNEGIHQLQRIRGLVPDRPWGFIRRNFLNRLGI